MLAASSRWLTAPCNRIASSAGALPATVEGER